MVHPGTIGLNYHFELLIFIDPFDGAQAPPFRTGRKAPLRVNPEQAPAFRSGSRRVDFFLTFQRLFYKFSFSEISKNLGNL